MAYTPGDFSPSLMGKVIMKETDMLNGMGRTLAELKQPIVAGQAILAHQSPEIVRRFEGEECIEAKVVALRGYNNALEGSSTITCDIPDANELGSESLILAKELLVNPVRFTIKEKECHDAFSWDERLTFNMLRAKALIEIGLTNRLVTMASTEADVPSTAWFEKTTGTVNGNSFDVTAANFAPELYADILYASQINDINNPIVINGVNFYHDTFLSKYKGMACCDNDSVLTGAPFSVYFDLKNVDSTLGGKTTLAIDENALLFWSSENFTNEVPELKTDDTYVWRDKLPRLQYRANGAMQDIYVDVRAQKKCLDGHRNIQWNFELTVWGNIKANLADHNDRQGIIKVTQVA